MPRALRYLLVVGGAIVSILLFLLSSASSNSDFFAQHYPWLIGLNALMAVLLFVLVALLLIRLYRRYKRGQFGSRLTARLVIMFALIGILPGAVIYIVSVQFVSRSIESWFDVHVENALASGVTLSHTALDTSLNELRNRARSLASEWSELSNSEQATQLGRLSEQDLEASIVTANGQIIASVGGKLEIGRAHV